MYILGLLVNRWYLSSEAGKKKRREKRPRTETWGTLILRVWEEEEPKQGI